jgi:site-specific DNA recombinase
MFPGLTKCGECGGGFNLSSQDHLICFNASARHLFEHAEHQEARCRNTCSQGDTRAVARAWRLRRILRELYGRIEQTPQGAPGKVIGRTARGREHRSSSAGDPEPAARGIRNEAFKDELRKLDERKAELAAAIAAQEVEPAMPALHPNMASVFGQKVAVLAESLAHEGQRDAARESLRELIDQIVIPAADGLLQVVGNLGAMLNAAAGQKLPGRQAVGNVGCGGGI